MKTIIPNTGSTPYSSVWRKLPCVFWWHCQPFRTQVLVLWIDFRDFYELLQLILRPEAEVLVEWTTREVVW